MVAVGTTIADRPPHRTGMKKISTRQAFSNEILKEQKLTIGVDLGRSTVF